MKLSDLYNAVSRRTDTHKTAINVSETKRVLSEAFLVLAELSASEMAETLSKGLAQASKKHKQ